MIERKQDQLLPNKQWKAFVFTTQPCRGLGMLMNEKDNEKVIALKVEVVEAWQFHADLLNANAEIEFKNMFFIPMSFEKQQHHVVFVVDTRKKVVHNLDNKKKKKEYKDAAILHKLIVGCFSDFLDALKHPCADEVLDYNLSIVKMPWTVNEANDFGVYAAFFMEQFMGDKDFGLLTSSANRIRYRESICSRLVLSDVNKNGDVLLKNVDTFNKEKEIKRPLIMAEREYAQKKKEEDAQKKREEYAKKKEEDVQKKREKYAKKKEEYAQKKKEEDAQRKKVQKALKGLHEMKKNVDEDKGPKRTSRNKLVPVKNMTKWK